MPDPRTGVRQQNTARATRPGAWVSFEQLAAAVSARLISTTDCELDQCMATVKAGSARRRHLDPAESPSDG